MLLLAIDQGNSRTKFGLVRQGELERTWAVPTEKTAAVAHWSAAAFAAGVPHGTPVALCSVVPELLPVWAEVADRVGSPLTVITGSTPTPLVNAYTTPATLGADRLMAAVAAAYLVGVPVLSVSVGTATVVDAVGEGSTYLGGMIAPGIAATTQALSEAASTLGPAVWREPTHAIGQSSEEALANGLFYASIGGLRAMIEAIRTELRTDAPLALTGGWADRVAPHLTGVARVEPHLVLLGIARTLAR